MVMAVCRLLRVVMLLDLDTVSVPDIYQESSAAVMLKWNSASKSDEKRKCFQGSPIPYLWLFIWHLSLFKYA